MEKTKKYGNWNAPKQTPDLTGKELQRWKEATLDLATMASDVGWSMEEIIRRSGIKSATFSEWYHGRYQGNISGITNRVEEYLRNPDSNAHEETALAQIKGTSSNYEAWETPRETPDLEEPELARWKNLTEECATVAAQHKWSKSEVSRRSETAGGTFSQWYDGKYKGIISNVSDKIERWLDSVKELAEAAAKVPATPGFVNTPTAIELTETLLYAQLLADMVIITLAPGMGKTMTANHYRKTRTHTFIVTMRPSTSKSYNMMLELGRVLDISERNPAKLDSAIGDALKANGKQTLLIVDEAQVLDDNAVNQLRHFLDIYKVGIALMGNEELYGRFTGRKALISYAQLNRRIGKRLKRLKPLAADIEAIIDAWKVKDPQVRKLLKAIGNKPGALSQITKTMQLAGMLAAGEGTQITPKLIQHAWANRSGE